MCLCQGEDELLMVIEGDVFIFIFLLYLRLNVCNQVEDDLPMVVEEEVLGGGGEIEQEKKFTRPRFVQVRFFGFLVFFSIPKLFGHYKNMASFSFPIAQDELKMSKRLLIAVLVDKKLQNLQELAINMTLTKFVLPRKNPEKQIPKRL